MSVITCSYIKCYEKSNIINKENGVSYKKFKNRKANKRKIRSLFENLTPSVSEPKISKRILAHHAFMRIQLFFTSACAVFNCAERSNQTFVDIHFAVSSAKLQMGQGHSGSHAAHSHTAAHLTDNRKETILKEIINEQEITPKKLQYINSKLPGHLKVNPTLETLDSIVNRLQTQLSDSLLDDSCIEYVLNSTVILPSRVNLSVDCTLERELRTSFLPNLYKKLSKAELSPEDATVQYVEAIRVHFQTRLQTKLDPTLRKYIEGELAGTVIPNFDYLVKKNRTKQESQALSVELLSRKLF